MATTRLALQTKIYDILGKSPTAYGFLSPGKVNDAINDALAFIATMMNNVSSAWITNQASLNIVGGTATIALPTDCVIINFVKKLQANGQYVPIGYDESANTIVDSQPVNTANYTPSYRFSNGKLMLEPTPADNLTAGILLDYMAAPASLSADGSTVFATVDYPVFTEYAKWRAASIVWSLSQSQAMVPPWSMTEAMWLQEVKKTIAKRNAKPTMIEGMTNY